MSRNDYITDEDVREFIKFLAKDIKGEGQPLGHKLQIKDKKVPKNYESTRCINSLKEAYESYFWDSKDFTENSRLLGPLRLSLCEAYYSQDQERLVAAANEVFDWGLMPNAAEHNKRWAKEHKNFVSSIATALREVSSDDPKLGEFDDQTCRMNSGFTKVYALLHPGSIIYDGRVGAALGLLVSRFLTNEEGEATTLPPLLAFPWADGAGEANRNPSSGKLQFPRIGSENGNHALWNIRANWIIQEVVKKCFKSGGASWLTGDPVRQIEAALFMIGYEVGAPTPERDSSPKDGKTPKSTKQDKPPAANSGKESKKDKAKRIYLENPGLPKKEIIKKFIHECGLTENGANTYYGNLKSGRW